MTYLVKLRIKLMILAIIIAVGGFWLIWHITDPNKYEQPKPGVEIEILKGVNI